MKTYVVTFHKNRLDETVLMMGHTICVNGEKWLITSKLSLLPLLIWSMERLFDRICLSCLFVFHIFVAWLWHHNLASNILFLHYLLNKLMFTFYILVHFSHCFKCQLEAVLLVTLTTWGRWEIPMKGNLLCTFCAEKMVDFPIRSLIKY